MKILVCISHVPDTTSRINFIDNNQKFDTSGVQFIIGPYDDYALAKAVDLKEETGATVTVLNVGRAETEPTLRKALAIGADNAVRIDADPLDSIQVATLISNYAKGEGFDMILMGRESIDYNGGVVHGLVAEMLNITSISPVMTLKLNGGSAEMTREIEGGKEQIEVAMPFIAGCQEPIAEWKIPNMRGIMTARSKPLDVIDGSAVDMHSEAGDYSLPKTKSGVKLIDPENIGELVNLLKNEAKVI